MITAIATIIAYLLPFITEMVKVWQAGAPERKEVQRREQTQKGRTDIAAGNADSVSVRIDSVLAQTPGNSPELGTDEDTARRLAKITGE